MWKKIAAISSILGLAFTAPVALAQQHADASHYPSKPVQFLAGFPPGGVADIVARIIAVPLSKRLGQPVIVDNRAGAGGVVAVAAIAKAAPDGHTLGFGMSGALTSNVTLMPKLPYDPLKDIAPVSMVVDNPLAVVVNASSGIKTMQDFIANAKKQSKPVTYGTAGAGTAMNLAGELLNQKAGINMTHVSYKGSAPAAVDLLAGHIDAAILDLATAKPHLETGRLKALAVTSARRSALEPELPTIAESGVPGYEFSAWFSLVMPAGTPRDIVARVNKELTAVLKDPEVRNQLLAAKVEPIPGTPDELRNRIGREIKETAALIKAGNITLN
jgi:tripartite-type tricarboxylate transporter receptor subunit TctC